MEEAAVAAGAKPLKNTFAAIKVYNNSNALIDIILLKDGDNFNEEGDEDSQEDELEE